MLYCLLDAIYNQGNALQDAIFIPESLFRQSQKGVFPRQGYLPPPLRNTHPPRYQLISGDRPFFTW